MKYPKINKKELDLINKSRFLCLLQTIGESLDFDNKENDLGLSQNDKELLAWNIATNIISKPY